MGLQCDVCGKTPQNGHKVSHSNKKAPKIWRPNIQKVRVMVQGGAKRISVCVNCLRSGRVVKAVSGVKKSANA